MDGDVFIRPANTHVSSAMLALNSNCYGDVLTAPVNIYDTHTHTYLNNSFNGPSTLDHIHPDVHVRALSSIHLLPAD